MKNKKIPLLMAIWLLSMTPLTVEALVDPNYKPLNLSGSEVVAESPNPPPQEEVEAPVIRTAPVETTAEPTKTVTTTSVAAPRESAGVVLGVAKERDPLEKAYKLLEDKFNELVANYRDLQIQVAQLRASAEKTQEKEIIERIYQNILYVIFALILAFIMLFIELRYVKLSSRFANRDGRFFSFGKNVGKTKSKKDRR